MWDIDEMKSDLGAFSTKFALQSIIRKGGGDKVFYFDSEKHTPRTALIRWEKCLLDIHCGNLGIIRFYGGPPMKGKWYNGTILSMLCDLVLFDKFSFEESAEGQCAWLSA